MNIEEQELPQEVKIIKRACVFCKKIPMLACGSWTANIIGCCTKIVWKGTHYIHPRKAHIDCLINAKNKRPKNLYLKDDKQTQTEFNKIKKKNTKRYPNLFK